MNYYSLELQIRTKDNKRLPLFVMVFFEEEQPLFLNVWDQVWKQAEKMTNEKIEYIQIIKIEGQKPIKYDEKTAR